MEPTQQEPEKTENLIADYHDDIRQIEAEGYELVVKKARNALYWAGGLIFLGEMITMGITTQRFDWLVLIIALIEAGIFIGLALFTKKKPYTAILSGLIVFIVLIGIGAAAMGMNEGATGVLKGIFSGIFIKIAILIALIRPLKEAKELQAIKDERKGS